MKKRSNHIDIAKGIAIILVVYGHAATQLKGYPVYQEYLETSTKVIFSFVMPLFFIISGAFQRIRLYSRTFNNKIYLSKITKSILLPFYTLSIVFMLINIAMSSIISAPSVKDMFYGLAFQQSNGNLLPSGVLWFLFTLYLFHIITYFHVKLFDFNIIYLVIIALILRTEVNIFAQYHYLAYDKISNFFIFYLFGYYFYKTIIETPFQNPLILIILTASYIFLFYINNFYNNVLSNSLLMVLSPFGISGIMLSLLTIGISFIFSSKFNESTIIKVLIYYGAYSMLVYVFHMPTFTIFKKIASIINIEHSYTNQLILFIPGIILPLIYGKILSYNKAIYKILLGRNP